MTQKNFEPHLIVRTIGKHLIICCLVNKKSRMGTPVEISQWIKKEMKLEKELPSSFLYPTLKELAGGQVPILTMVGKNYIINPNLEDSENKILEEFIEIEDFFSLASELFSTARSTLNI